MAERAVGNDNMETETTSGEVTLAYWMGTLILYEGGITLGELRNDAVKFRPY